MAFTLGIIHPPQTTLHKAIPALRGLRALTGVACGKVSTVKASLLSRLWNLATVVSRVRLPNGRLRGYDSVMSLFRPFAERRTT